VIIAEALEKSDIYKIKNCFSNKFGFVTVMIKHVIPVWPKKLPDSCSVSNLNWHLRIID
jgi:hypothetical protein